MEGETLGPRKCAFLLCLNGNCLSWREKGQLWQHAEIKLIHTQRDVGIDLHMHYHKHKIQYAYKHAQILYMCKACFIEDVCH